MKVLLLNILSRYHHQKQIELYFKIMSNYSVVKYTLGRHPFAPNQERQEITCSSQWGLKSQKIFWSKGNEIDWY